MANSVFATESDLKAHFDHLKLVGFYTLKFPGGTSRYGEHFSMSILWRISKDKKSIEVVVIPYDSTFYKKQDQPKTNSKPETETPEETLRRESFEETGLIPQESVLIHQQAEKPLYGQNRDHIKYVYATEIKNCSGNLFDFAEDHNISDGEIGCPFWTDLKLLKYLYLSKGHRSITWEPLIGFFKNKSLETYEIVSKY